MPYGIGCMQGVSGASTLAKLRYQRSKHLSPEAETGISTTLDEKTEQLPQRFLVGRVSVA